MTPTRILFDQIAMVLLIALGAMWANPTPIPRVSASNWFLSKGRC